MIKVKALGFDWDAGNRNKCRKHGLTPFFMLPARNRRLFQTGQSLYIAPDFEHSKKEARYLAAGRSQKGRPIFVVFSLRQNAGGLLIRPISARYIHKKEAKKHEQESSET
ncbi:MAG: BrnT family toxin [Nitrospinales bacterium]